MKEIYESTGTQPWAENKVANALTIFSIYPLEAFYNMHNKLQSSSIPLGTSTMAAMWIVARDYVKHLYSDRKIWLQLERVQVVEGSPQINAALKQAMQYTP